MKIDRKDIGVKETPEVMKNAAIARKKAFVKAIKKQTPAPKPKRVAAKVSKPAIIRAKVVASAKKALKKKKR